jgi:xylulokinase
VSDECVVAVDIGTQSTRAALVDVHGQILDTASSPIELYAPRPGWAEQDPEQWWETTVANIAAIVARNRGTRVAAVGVGAQMHSLVAVDASGVPVTARSAIWSDKRCLEQVQALLSRPDAGELCRLAGNHPVPAWAGFKMAWLRASRPAAYDRAAYLLVAKDFVNLRLCGQAATDPTEASGTFLCDASTGQWSGALLAALDVDRAKLPQIAEPSAVIGTVRGPAADRTGLPAGTPVVAGSGDMLCQLLGSGITRPGRVAVVAGTASIVAVAADRPTRDTRLMNLRSASGDWVHFGISDAAGKAFSWFAHQLCPPLGTRETADTKAAFDALTLTAADVEAGSGGLLFLPYLLGERTLGSAQSRASFIGATLGHDRAHFIRAVMEGITMEDRRALQCLCPVGVRGPIRCTGGGADSRLWNQIRADIFGHPVQTLAHAEGGIQGAAILAGVGAGWYPDAAVGADEVIQPAETWTPSPAAAGAYEASFRTFCAVHDALDGVWARWNAP